MDLQTMIETGRPRRFKCEMATAIIFVILILVVFIATVHSVSSTEPNIYSKTNSSIFAIFENHTDQLRERLEHLKKNASKEDESGTKANVTDPQSLLNALRSVANEVISNSSIKDDLWPDIHSLSTLLLKTSPEVVLNTWSEIIDMFTVQTILQIATKFNFTETEMYIHKAVFDQMENKNELNTTISISLARAIKRIMNYYNHRTYPSLWKVQYENMKNKLPEAIKNLVFSYAVCLKNSYYGEYLFASDTKTDARNLNTFKSRPVHTWTRKNLPKPSLPNFKWRVNFIDDYQIELSNIEFDEKLSVYYYNSPFDKKIEKRLAFTHPPQNYEHEALSLWNVTVDEKGLRLENDEMEEYLVADSTVKKDDHRRYVITLNPPYSGEMIGSNWEVYDCSKSLPNVTDYSS